MKALAAILLVVVSVANLRAESAPPLDPARAVAFEQHLKQPLALGTNFRDETGQPVQLGHLLNHQPAVIALVYFECPNLCTIVLNGLLAGLRDLRGSPGRDFQVIIVSIDPHETPGLAAQKKATMLRHYGRSGTEAGWHFLTGDQASIAQLADSIGFRYYYDTQIEQYAHPSGIAVVTPEGIISQYLLGIEFPPAQLSAALDRAGRSQIGSIVQNVLLLCFHYDPNTGRHSLIITRALQIAGTLTVLALATLLWRLRRPELSTSS